jgi:uncharacterized protein
VSSPTTGVAPIPVGPDAVAAMSPSNYVTAQTLREGGDDGVAHTFGPGDSFTLTRGWRGEYRVTEPLVKQFAIYAP